MMRRAEGALGKQAVGGGKLSGNRMDFGGFQRLIERKRRQDAGKALGQHGFARTRRTNQNDVMSAGGGDLQRTFDVFLSLDIGKIRLILAGSGLKCPARVQPERFERALAVEKPEDLQDTCNAIYFQAAYDGGFPHILFREKEPFKAFPARLDGNGKNTFDRLQTPVQGKFAHDHIPLDAVSPHLSGGGQDTGGDAKIVGRPFLADIGRCKVYQNSTPRHTEPAVPEGGINPLVTFPYRAVGQTYNGITVSAADIDFGSDGNGFDALNGTAIGFDKHSPMFFIAR